MKIEVTNSGTLTNCCKYRKGSVVGSYTCVKKCENFIDVNNMVINCKKENEEMEKETACKNCSTCKNYDPKVEWKVGDCFIDENGNKRMIIYDTPDVCEYQVIDKNCLVLNKNNKTIIGLIMAYKNPKHISLKEFWGIE